MPNDTNIVLGKTATASTSMAPYLPSKAVDGNKTSGANRWLAIATPGWLSVDLGKPFAISRWCVSMLPACTDPASRWPTSYVLSKFELQVSQDNVNWTRADIVAGNTLPSTDRALVVPVAARYVRLWTDTGIAANARVLSIQELEVYGHETSSLLSNLVISSGALVPAFSSTGNSYSVQVGGDVSSITLTPTAVDSTARITVNGTQVASGQASASVNLNVGANTIAVVVTPLSGAATTYTVTATRQASAGLSSLTVNSNQGTCTLAPSFSSNTLVYGLTIPAQASTVTVTPTAAGQGSTIRVNGVAVNSGGTSAPIPVVSGSVSIAIEVTSAAGAKQTYTVSAVEPSYLKALQLKGGPATLTLAPTFVKEIFEYTTHTSATNVLVTASALSGTASVAINGTETTGSVTVALSGASTLVEINVVDGAANSTYKVTVLKP